jgi:hypothetical protein
VLVVREGKNLRGRLLGFLLKTIAKRVLKRAFENSVKAIEARNGQIAIEPPRTPALRSAPTR